MNGSGKCDGLITRRRNNEASVIDFVIVSKDVFEDVDSLLIDEHKIMLWSDSQSQKTAAEYRKVIIIQ